jgi:hypothetical protein
VHCTYKYLKQKEPIGFEYSDASNDLSLTSRAYIKEKNYVIAFAGTYNITSNHPQRYDFLLGQ